jgi:hypothetical protein
MVRRGHWHTVALQVSAVLCARVRSAAVNQEAAGSCGDDGRFPVAWAKAAQAARGLSRPGAAGPQAGAAASGGTP